MAANATHETASTFTRPWTAAIPERPANTAVPAIPTGETARTVLFTLATALIPVIINLNTKINKTAGPAGRCAPAPASANRRPTAVPKLRPAPV